MARSVSSGEIHPSRVAVEREALLAARELVDRMRTMYRQLEQRTGAPIAMHRALACLAADPGIPASHLAETLGMKRPAVSHMLKALAAKGWIERTRRDPDQRMVRLTITPAGRAVVSATAGRVVGTLQRAVQDLDARELGELARGLRALLERLPDERPVVARTDSR